MEADRLKRQEEYKREVQQLRDELSHARRKIKYRVEQEEQEINLQKERENLVILKETVSRIEEKALKDASTKTRKKPIEARSDPLEIQEGAAAEWSYMKDSSLAKNPPLDELMGMIGLEEVKSEFIDIKSEVDIAILQGIPLTNKRYGATLLGNPGTGMYQLLSSAQVSK